MPHYGMVDESAASDGAICAVTSLTDTGWRRRYSRWAWVCTVLVPYRTRQGATAGVAMWADFAWQLRLHIRMVEVAKNSSPFRSLIAVEESRLAESASDQSFCVHDYI